MSTGKLPLTSILSLMYVDFCYGSEMTAALLRLNVLTLLSKNKRIWGIP